MTDRTVFDYIRAVEASRRGDSAALETFKGPDVVPAPARPLTPRVAPPVKPRQTGLGL